jgi:hypothetical protein
LGLKTNHLANLLEANNLLHCAEYKFQKVFFGMGLLGVEASERLGAAMTGRKKRSNLLEDKLYEKKWPKKLPSFVAPTCPTICRCLSLHI